MNCALRISLLGVTGVLVSACGNLATSLNNQNFDPGTNPLDSPGNRVEAEVAESGPAFAPGSWVEITDGNAGLYRRMPRDNEQADYSLKLGTPLKVVGSQGSYVKVETESGQIGYVPAIMVGTKPSGNEIPLTSPELGAPPPSIDPIDSIGPIDPIDPNIPSIGDELPIVEDGPFVAPEPEVPPISVEEAPPPPSPVVPPDPLGGE